MNITPVRSRNRFQNSLQALFKLVNKFRPTHLDRPFHDVHITEMIRRTQRYVLVDREWEQAVILAE